MIDVAKQMLQDSRAYHRSLMGQIVELEETIKATSKLEELADIAFALREAHKVIDHARKELDKNQKLVAHVFTLCWASQPDASAAIETKICSVTPDPVVHSSVPKPSVDKERYDAVMKDFLGIDPGLVDRGFLRLDWEQFGAFVTEKFQDEGGVIPQQLDPDKTYTEYRLRIRAKKSEEASELF